MNPTPADLHVDQLLTNASIGYKNPAYIADGLFPLLPVTERSGIVPKFLQSAFFRDGAHLRLPGTPSQGSGFGTDISDHFYCERYSFRWELDDDTKRIAPQVWRLEQTGVDFVMDKLQMRREILFATNNFKTGVWKTDKVGAVDFAVWSDYGLSYPLRDLSEYMDIGEALIGLEFNSFTLGKQVWLKLKWHPDLVDTIKHTQRGQITREIAESLFELAAGGLKIGRSIYTADPAGTAEASVTYSRIWGKHGLLLYTPTGPSLVTPAAGYTIAWQVVPNALQYIKRMRNEEREVDIIEGNSYFQQKVTSTRAGLFMSGVVV